MAVNQEKYQERAEEHFSSTDTSRWKPFRKNLRAKSFVAAVKNDDRADDRLKNFAENVGRHLRASGGTKVQGAGGTYTVKFHPVTGRYSCSCGDWVYTKAPLETGDCKHIRQVRKETPMLLKRANDPLLSTGIKLIRHVHYPQAIGQKAKEQKAMNDAYETYMPRRGLGHELKDTLDLIKHAAVMIRGQVARRLMGG